MINLSQYNQIYDLVRILRHSSVHTDMKCVYFIHGDGIKARYLWSENVKEKMAKSLLKHHCFYPMLLMQTTKTVDCLKIKAILHHLCWFGLVF